MKYILERRYKPMRSSHYIIKHKRCYILEQKYKHINVVGLI